MYKEIIFTLIAAFIFGCAVELSKIAESLNTIEKSLKEEDNTNE